MKLICVQDKKLRMPENRHTVIPGGNAGNRQDSRHLRPGIHFLSCTQEIDRETVNVIVIGHKKHNDLFVRGKSEEKERPLSEFIKELQ